MGRLMARKKELAFDERDDEAGAARTGATGESRKPKAKKDATKGRIAPEDMGEELSTTAKLLEKRKKKKR